MILLDLSHTAHSGARTGIQRVCRSLHRELPGLVESRGLCWDPYEASWRLLAGWEETTLQIEQPGRRRGAHWPVLRQIEGRLRRRFGRSRELSSDELTAAKAIVFPEMFSPKVAAALPRLRARTQAPLLAIFHDAIALRLPELSPSGTVARYPGYLQELAEFDGIAAVSEDSRQSLLDYWEWLGLRTTPEVCTIPLGIDLPATAAPMQTKTSPTNESAAAMRPPSTTAAGSQGPRVLCLCSIEGRKNHLALLGACESLWAEGHSFQLDLAGFAQRETGAAALERIEALQKAGRPLRYHGPVSEAHMEELYQSCDFTVYPSIMEGFGLPVLESMARGKPCLCSGQGALGESAAGGGCLLLPTTTSTSIAAALRRLLTEPGLRAKLASEASQRPLRSWQDYARDLGTWAIAQRRRPSSL